jgi:hypothetical protein
MTAVTLPDLEQIPTTACSARRVGSKISMVVVHRWGVAAWKSEAIDGVIGYFRNPANQVSSHLVYAGEQGPDAGRCVQMVPLAQKAWTEAAFNSVGVSVESTDRVWLGDDLAGLHRLARIVGWLLHHHGLPAVDLEGAAVLNGKGFTRHGALGVNGGGHPACPTTSPSDPRWVQFRKLVKDEYLRDSYRKVWAL